MKDNDVFNVMAERLNLGLDLFSVENAVKNLKDKNKLLEKENDKDEDIIKALCYDVGRGLRLKYKTHRKQGWISVEVVLIPEFIRRDFTNDMYSFFKENKIKLSKKHSDNYYTPNAEIVFSTTIEKNSKKKVINFIDIKL